MLKAVMGNEIYRGGGSSAGGIAAPAVPAELLGTRRSVFLPEEGRERREKEQDVNAPTPKKKRVETGVGICQPPSVRAWACPTWEVF